MEERLIRQVGVCGIRQTTNPEIELFRSNQANTYYSGNIDFNEVDIQSLEYMLPIVAGKVQGVYEIESIGFKKLSKTRPLRQEEEDNLRIVFTLGNFVRFIDNAVSCQNKIHNNKVYGFDEMKRIVLALQ